MSIPERLPAVLATTVMGAYLLLIVGATTSLTEATAACAGWPACGDGYMLPNSTAGWVALTHRVIAVVVGVLVALSTVLAWRASAPRRVRVALAGATVLFAVQAGMGALVAVGGVSPAIGFAHLVVGVVIFASVLAALGWYLEIETGSPHDEEFGDVDRSDTSVGTASSTQPAGSVQADGSAGTTDSVSGTPSTHPHTTGPASRISATLRAYFRLMKPRLMWLLCLVAAAAMALAGGPGFTPYTVAATLVGGSLAIGASGTFNHVLERDVDKRMQRTSDRPLATDIVSVPSAVTFGLLLTAVSIGLFSTINVLTAGLGLLAILFYSVVYTLILKPNTVQNTVLGGAAGALPALIGWAAVTGTIGGGGLLLALLIFLWTPAHFYNLALAYKSDYARGGFPMMPVVRGDTTTRKHIMWYLGATFLAAAVLALTAEPLGGLYATVGVVLGAVFLWAVIRLHYERTESAALRAFHASNAYLGVLLFAVVFDALLV